MCIRDSKSKLKVSQLVFVTIFTHLFLLGHAQREEKIPILREELSQELTDTARVHRLLSLAYAYRRSNLDSSLVIGNKAIALAQTIENDSLVAEAHFGLSSTYVLLSNPDSAKYHRLKELSYQLKVNDKRKIASAYRGLAAVGELTINPDTMLYYCLLYTSPSPRDRTRSRMPSSA